MEISKYREMEELEKFHWWFVYRQSILRIVLKKYLSELSSDAKVLDIGCGTGGNLLLLSEEFSSVQGIDCCDVAIDYCKDKNLEVIKAELPDLSVIEDESLDLILLFDVLEHVEDDEFTLSVIKSKLKNDGILLMTVPAFSFLWSKHDEGFHHKRRYNMLNLSKKVKNAKFDIIKATYLYFLLFPAVLCMRLLKKIFKGYAEKDDFKVNSNLLNSFMIKVLSIETLLFKYIDYPFGSSIFMLLKK